MSNPTTVRFSGPLTDHVEGLWRELLARGYSPLSACNVLRVAAHLSRWLEAQALGLDALDSSCVDTFFEARRRAGYTQFLTPRALAPVLQFFERVGAVTVTRPAIVPASPLDRLLGEYARFLVHERILSPGAVRTYTDTARQFLTSRFSRESVDLEALCAQDVVAWILEYSRYYSIGTTKLRVTALRSFLRYAYREGTLPVDLGAAVPAVAGWRLVGLPQGLDDTEVQHLLCACDRRRPQGRRSYAVLLLMLRLGLRACEVAALTLEDIDWQGAEITVCGKGREHCLPLPADVGRALAAHLRANRAAAAAGERHVFPRIRAPYGPLGSAGVLAILRTLFRHAGIASVRPYRLRHTAATRMLRNGASLDAIAQVLGHRSHDTTAIYAKVDRDGLRGVVQPWPGAVS